MPDCSTAERAAMPGLLTQVEVRDLKSAPPEHFDAIFVELMSRHHRGAVKMADQMWQSRSDPAYASWLMPFATSSRERLR